MPCTYHRTIQGEFTDRERERSGERWMGERVRGKRGRERERERER